MAILTTDLKYKLSTTAGSAGNTLAQGTPANSLGKYVATTVVDQGVTLHNLFPKLTGPQNAASVVHYLLVFVHNDHATLTAEALAVWIDSQVSGGASIAIGLDPAGNVVKGSASAQAATIASITDAPAGVTFTAPTDYAGGLVVGDLQAGYVRGVWVRRTAANTAAKDADGATLKVQSDTAE